MAAPAKVSDRDPEVLLCVFDPRASGPEEYRQFIGDPWQLSPETRHRIVERLVAIALYDPASTTSLAAIRLLLAMDQLNLDSKAFAVIDRAPVPQ
jgi:hypothetical protein